jgi:AhpD family alkylhydroperoxidase
LLQAWRTYHDGVFKDGALSKIEKELIAVAGAHITGCPYSIRSRVRSSKNSGATDEQIVESIYVAMRFAMGGPFAFSSMRLRLMTHLITVFLLRMRIFSRKVFLKK